MAQELVYAVAVAVQGLRGGCCAHVAVRGDEAGGLRVVVARVEVVELALGVVLIPAIEHAAGVSALGSLHDLAEGVVCIARDYPAVLRRDGLHVTVAVVDVVVIRMYQAILS